MTQSILQMKPKPADARLHYGDGELHFADLRLPDRPGPYPVMIVVHGGFWRAAYDLQHIGHLCEALRNAGVATWSIEYRRIGNPGGGWPGTLQDAGMAADHLRRIATDYHLDLDRAAAIGHSAGGQIALWLAARGKLPSGHLLRPPSPLPLRGVVALAPVADLRRGFELKLSNTVVADFLGGAPDEVEDRYAVASPIERLPLGIPQKLIHGTNDRNVPFEISERYASEAKKHGDDVELIALEGADHFAVIDPRSKEFAQVESAVLKVLGNF
jgi:acetyl esterase/lipase